MNKENFIAGTDVDRDAVNYAKQIYEKMRPDGNFHFYNLGLTEAVMEGCDVALLNPPFNIYIEKNFKIPFNGALWGKNGPYTAIWSHVAATANAVQTGARLIVLILPENAFKNERDLVIGKLLEPYSRIFYAKVTDTSIFEKEGAKTKFLITVYLNNSLIDSYCPDETRKQLEKYKEKFTEPIILNSIDSEKLGQVFKQYSPTLRKIPILIKKRNEYYNCNSDVTIKNLVNESLIPPFAKEKLMPLNTTGNQFKFAVSPDASRFVIKPNSIYALLPFFAFIHRLPIFTYNDRSYYVKKTAYPFIARFGEMVRNKRHFDNLLTAAEKELDCKTTPEFEKVLKKRKNEYARENKYFEKWTETDGTINVKRIRDFTIPMLPMEFNIQVEKRWKGETYNKTYLTIMNEKIFHKPVWINTEVTEPTHVSFTADLHLKAYKIDEDGTIIFNMMFSKIHPEEIKKFFYFNERSQALTIDVQTEYNEDRGIDSSTVQAILNTLHPQKKGKQWVLNDENSLIKAFPKLYNHIEKEIEKTGIPLWEFQRRDIIRALMKPNAVIGAEMGLGKTRMFLTIAAVLKNRGVQKVLIVTEAKLVSGYVKEAKKINYKYKIKIIRKAKDIPKSFSDTVCVIPYSILWRENNNIKFTKIFKRVNTLLIDEMQNLKSPNTNQTRAVRKIKAKRKILASGTPIKNYPYNFFSPMNVAFGGRTNINLYSYHSFVFRDGYLLSGRKQFITDFVIIREYSPRFEQTVNSGKKKKQYPGIRDLVRFEDLVRKMIIRRVKREPEVQKEIAFPTPQFYHIDVTPDKKHRDFYRILLERFRDWMLEHINVEGADSERKLSSLEILTQLMTLQFASTLPQRFTDDSVDEFIWKGPKLTVKQKKIIEVAGRHYNNGDKVIVFSERPELCEYLHKMTIGYTNFVFTGQIPNKKREEILDEFKKVEGGAILYATIRTGGTGLNIPEANVVIIADPSWVPSDTEQGYSRILRPEQTKQPIVYFIRNKGMIDQYMRQLEMYKRSAISEGLDGQQDRMQISEYISYKDFAMQMLSDTGLFVIKHSNELAEV